MSKKAPDYTSEIFGSTQDGPPKTVLDMMSVASKPAPKRTRTWENRKPAAVYRIPAPLIHLAKDAQTKILSRAESDEHGRLRAGLTADMVAGVILDWAIQRVKENPKALTLTASPHTKGGLTAYAEEWNDWDGKSPAYPAPRRKNKSQKTPRFLIAYRLEEKTKNEIKRIAEDSSLPLGEVFLFLMRLGLTGHDNGKFRIKTKLQAVCVGAEFENVEN